MFDLAMESQSEANFMSNKVQNIPWKVYTKQLSKFRAKVESHGSSVPNGNPDGG